MLEKTVAAHTPKDPGPQLVEACPAGCVLFKDDYSTCSVCPVCKEDRWYIQENISSRRKPRGHFVHYSATDQLSMILEDTSKVDAMEKYVKSFQDRNRSLAPDAEPDIVSDYFDGQAYLTACRDGIGNFGKEKTLYLALSADGVEYSKKPSKSVWPFALEIINFPPSMRRQIENAIIIGILFGYPKDMTSVLKFLTDDMKSWNHHEWKLQFCYLIAETPALNKLLGLVGHTGIVKCPQHTNRGFDSPGHGSYYMPNELPRPTTKENRDALKHNSNLGAKGVPFGDHMDRLDWVIREGIRKMSVAESIEEKDAVKQEYGPSNQPSPLNTLPGFLYDTAATYKSLHISLLTVGRLVLKLYCSKFKKSPVGGENEFELSDKQLDGVCFVERKRDLSSANFTMDKGIFQPTLYSNG